MRSCIFCGGPAGNAEHVVAEWLSKAMSRRDQQISAISHNGNQIIERRPPILFKSLTLKKVCKGCNNGWMSQLESDFQTAFEGLVVPRAFNDAQTVKVMLAANRDLLIRWMLKTAVVAEQAMPRGEKLIVPASLSDARGLKIDKHGIHLLAAEITESDFTVRLRKGYRTFNGGSYQDQVCADGFNFSIQLNHLALMLVNCPGAFAGAVSPYSIQGRQVMPLLPSTNVEWGMSISHLFLTFDHFVESLEVYATEP